MHEDELTEARKREGVLRVLVGEGGNDLEDRDGLFLGELCLLGDSSGDLGLGEALDMVFMGWCAVMRFYLVSNCVLKTSEK